MREGERESGRGREGEAADQQDARRGRRRGPGRAWPTFPRGLRQPPSRTRA